MNQRDHELASGTIARISVPTFDMRGADPLKRMLDIAKQSLAVDQKIAQLLEQGLPLVGI